MAFINPIPIFPPSTTFTSSLSSHHNNVIYNPIHPTVRRVRLNACISSDIQASDHKIIHAKNPDDLHYIYSIWNTIAEDESLRPVAPDERDSNHSTIHLLAKINSSSNYVGAARLLRDGQNACLDRVCVLPEYRDNGVGRALVEKLLVLAAPVQGAIYVNAIPGADMGFFSIMGFETLGSERMENGAMVRTMVYRIPVCAPASGCVGLHHTSIRVSDIERSLAFYGSVGFYVSEKFFTSSGNRACYVEGLGTRLEFVESPDGRGGLTGLQGVPPAGFDRLVFDVTKACTDLEMYLDHLEKRNGGILSVAGPPAKQVIGQNVVSVATILDPDDLPIEFIRTEAQVPGELRTKIKW